MSSSVPADRGDRTVELALRLPTAADAPAVYAAVRESMPELGRWMPWCHPGYSEADALAWAESRAAALAEGAAHEFLIVAPDDTLLGVCGINGVDAAARRANLGYWVRTPCAGRGVASTAARRLAEYAFRETSLERLEIVCAVGNVRSEAVARRLGATREGIVSGRLVLQGEPRDVVVYALLRP